MLLEGYDPKYPKLICILSVADIQGIRLKLHFDGYNSTFDFWRNSNSKFIFPVGYCHKNQLNLTHPYGNFKYLIV